MRIEKCNRMLTAEIHLPSYDLHLNLFRVTDIKCRFNIGGKRETLEVDYFFDTKNFFWEPLEMWNYDNICYYYVTQKSIQILKFLNVYDEFVINDSDMIKNFKYEINF